VHSHIFVDREVDVALTQELEVIVRERRIGTVDDLLTARAQLAFAAHLALVVCRRVVDLLDGLNGVHDDLVLPITQHTWRQLNQTWFG